MDLLPSILKAQAQIDVKHVRKDGGDIRITTPQLDRQRDRVLPAGGRLDNYRRNPVVQWGHAYQEPWQTIGRTLDLSITADGIDASFELREPASETDPQHIVLQLWNERFINTASIGFQPLEATPNDFGGLDFVEWELLEWSLVPIPANASALRLALEQHPAAAKAFGMVVKRGRVLSAKNEERIRTIAELAQAMLDELNADVADTEKQRAAPVMLTDASIRQLTASLTDALRPLLPTLPPSAPLTAAPDVTGLLTALRHLRRVTAREEHV
jgi:hypothetical protein